MEIDLSSLLGKIIVYFFSNFPIDKLLGLCYIGNASRLGRGREAEITEWKMRPNSKALQFPVSRFE